MPTAAELSLVADRAWRWVLDQVRTDELGPWIPEQVTGTPADETPGEYRDGMHSGISGLAHVLAEIRLDRSWTDEETGLAAAIGDRVRARIPSETSPDFFDGLVSDLGTLLALEQPGAEGVVQRLLSTMQDDGWPQDEMGPPRFADDSRLSDATLGTAGALLGAVWGERHGVAGARELAEKVADILLAEAEEVGGALNWRFVPLRFRLEQPVTEMPNWSHGLAGILATVALAAHTLDRDDLRAAATRGAEHLVSLNVRDDGTFAVPHYLPPPNPSVIVEDELAWGWCHGATGTSLAFAALDHAGVSDVAGSPPETWRRRCLDGVRRSGIPERRDPGFWDNDGRCCGTAGVGAVLLESYRRSGEPADLGFAMTLADALLDRAGGTDEHASWQFVEHRGDPPLLPPGVGWMQGAAGIAGFLMDLARVVRGGPGTPGVRRMETWWASP